MNEEKLNKKWLKDELKDFFYSNEFFDKILELLSNQYINGLEQSRFEKNLLEQENQELKKQLKIKHNVFMASVNKSCELAKENQQYKEAINKTNVFLDNHDKNAGKLYYKYDNKYSLSEIKEDLRDILKEVE